MYPVIYKYLLQHKKVSIPGIGSFMVKHKSANVDAESGSILAPKSLIEFNAETALADKSFYNFVSKELHIEEIDAIKNFHEYTYQLRQDSTKAESIIFPGIGTLTKQPSGGYQFLQEEILKDYFPDVKFATTEVITTQPAETIKHEQPVIKENFQDIELTPVDADEAEDKEDYWWIYAAILALLGVAGIVYKFV